MRGGYAAACAARLRPSLSRPCARCSCGTLPCAQPMAPSGSIASRSSSECAIVVYFCHGAPKLHCAKVRFVAPAASSAASTCGFSQIGAWSACSAHHASDSLSPRSAGFSSAQAAPAACAASISSAVHRANALCFAKYARHSGGAFSSPPGCRLERSCGLCEMEYDAHGVAMKTASNSRRRTRRSSASPTSLRSTSCRAPPCFVSTAVTLIPRARRHAGRSRSPPSPAKTTSTSAHAAPLGARHGASAASPRPPVGPSRFVEPCATLRSRRAPRAALSAPPLSGRGSGGGLSSASARSAPRSAAAQLRPWSRAAIASRRAPLRAQSSKAG